MGRTTRAIIVRSSTFSHNSRAWQLSLPVVGIQFWVRPYWRPTWIETRLSTVRRWPLQNPERRLGRLGEFFNDIA